MRSLTNQISSKYPLGTLYEALGLPVNKANFCIALTCEHERVFFKRTRTMVVREEDLRKLSEMLDEGINIDTSTVSIDGSYVEQRVYLLAEMAALYRADSSRFWNMELSVPSFPQSSTLE
jgi:hypothetical protein